MKSKDNEEKASKEEDKKVIALILSGDINKFAILQKKYYYLVLSLVRKIIKNDDDAEDVIQESFIKVYNSLASYNSEYAFSSWLYRIVSNACIDFFRVKKDLLYYDEDEEFEDSSLIPDNSIIESEKTKIIEDAINNLPPKYKEIFILRHKEELSYEEISLQLNMQLGTVKTNLFRARKCIELFLRKYPSVFNFS
ncbi:MAG: RNA polymerase sigma factor [Bacteroidetes bacterium]|nr:RNA polymerase sigma factor [Bacteroidota bacterium]